MPNTRQLLIVFLPALLLVGIGLAVGIARYEPLYPDLPSTEDSIDVIPVFPEDPIIGDKRAPLTIVAFEDFGCDGCKYQATLFDELLDRHPKAFKVIWKSLTVTRFPISTKDAHRYAVCAAEQDKFDAFKEVAFANGHNLTPDILDLVVEESDLNTKKLNSCLSSGRPEAHLTQNETLASLLNVQSVPTFFVDNIQIHTPESIDEWEQLLGL